MPSLSERFRGSIAELTGRRTRARVVQNPDGNINLTVGAGPQAIHTETYGDLTGLPRFTMHASSDIDGNHTQTTIIHTPKLPRRS